LRTCFYIIFFLTTNLAKGFSPQKLSLLKSTLPSLVRYNSYMITNKNTNPNIESLGLKLIIILQFNKKDLFLKIET
jgi:hypothetical protein